VFEDVQTCLKGRPGLSRFQPQRRTSYHLTAVDIRPHAMNARSDPRGSGAQSIVDRVGTPENRALAPIGKAYDVGLGVERQVGGVEVQQLAEALDEGPRQNVHPAQEKHEFGPGCRYRFGEAGIVGRARLRRPLPDDRLARDAESPGALERTRVHAVDDQGADLDWNGPIAGRPDDRLEVAPAPRGENRRAAAPASRQRHARAGWTITAGSPSFRPATQPMTLAPGAAASARSASAIGTTSVKPTPMLKTR